MNKRLSFLRQQTSPRQPDLEPALTGSLDVSHGNGLSQANFLWFCSRSVPFIPFSGIYISFFHSQSSWRPLNMSCFILSVRPSINQFSRIFHTLSFPDIWPLHLLEVVPSGNDHGGPFRHGGGYRMHYPNPYDNLLALDSHILSIHFVFLNEHLLLGYLQHPRIARTFVSHARQLHLPL